MKIALLINRDNFYNFSKWEDTGWDMIHMGSGEPDVDKIIATGANVIIVNAITRVGPEIINNMPELKLIHSIGVGFNAIDLDCARKAGVYVCNNPGANSKSVAEHAVMLMLTVLKCFRYNEDMVSTNRQAEAKTYYQINGLPGLSGLKVGIVGFGAIGRELAAMLNPFGCELFYYSRRKTGSDLDYVTYLPLEELYSKCDIISLNVPAQPETENMINSGTLKKFKRGAILINTARGDLMDQKAVADALISGQLGGFGADTLSPEPFTQDNPLIGGLPEDVRRRVALSPHIAGITSELYVRAYSLIRNNAEAILRGGRPECIVNGL